MALSKAEKKAFELKKTGLTYEQISDELNTQGFKSKMGLSFTPNLVGNVFNHPKRRKHRAKAKAKPAANGHTDQLRMSVPKSSELVMIVIGKPDQVREIARTVLK